ncbi:hypothetical protein NQZ68_036700 [Dissostichus eleginoides]|nr:hypothetical protein NQZ68_036700 [Dissostichus eleginoides]
MADKMDITGSREVEAGVEEAEAAEAQAAAEGQQALGGLEEEEEEEEEEEAAAAVEERLQAEAADPDPRGVDRTWVVLEADQHLTTGYEKISGMGKKGETFGNPENAWLTSVLR